MPLDVRAPLFFDTETTGLAGGTGTLTFLVGIAEWREGQVWSAQVHLPAPGHERPLLRWLAERIEAATVLVSFNGKSFDWPLLRPRSSTSTSPGSSSGTCTTRPPRCPTRASPATQRRPS